MKITAGTITQYNEGDTVLQAVPWSITDDEGELLSEGSQSFALDASADDIREFLGRCLDTYQADVALHEGAKELQAGLDNAAQVASEISGLEITN